MQLRRRFGAGSAVVGPLVAMLLLSAVVALTTDRFLQAENLRNIGLQVSTTALMAIGSTVVILAGGIDLSPGSTVALLTMVLAILVKFWGLPVLAGAVLTIILGCVLGSVNGLLSTYLGIPAFIATLATMSIFRGAAFMFNKGSPIFSVSPRLLPLFYGAVLGIPVTFLYMVIFYVLAFVLLRYTRTGREIYAVGGNAVAARFSGVNVMRIQWTTFVIAGGMSGVSAVLMAARLNSGSPNYGVGMEMSALAATVIGGTSLSGGHGNIVSTLFGALTIVIVQNGLNLHAVPTSLQNVIIGIIIILAVAIDRWRGRIGELASRLLGRRQVGKRLM